VVALSRDVVLPSLAGAAWVSAPPVRRIFAALSRGDAETRIIGGAVRDSLAGRPVGDIDFATTALPGEVTAQAARAGIKAVPTGIEHGTVTVITNGHPFEVTTLREDVETFGRHAKVAFGRDWRRDAERRDFTMNALSVAADGTLYDYVGGLADLEARRVRFIGDARTRIAEDSLRILRFFRFHAVYGRGLPDPEGVHACITGRAGLEQLSRERIRMEMLKLLLAVHAVPTLAVMTEAGLLDTVLGGVPNLASTSNMIKLEHALALPADAVRRLGALGVSVVEDAERLRERLRLSNHEYERLNAMADGWWRINAQWYERQGRVLLYRLRHERYTDRVLLAWSRADEGVADPRWRALATLPERWTAPVFPLKAADFLARGLAKGPGLGAAMRAAETAWVAADFPADAAALAAIADAAARAS
jgi:poly(A) polymerase